MNLNWNSFSFVSLQSFRIALNIFAQSSSFKEKMKKPNKFLYLVQEEHFDNLHP